MFSTLRLIYIERHTDTMKIIICKIIIAIVTSLPLVPTSLAQQADSSVGMFVSENGRYQLRTHPKQLDFPFDNNLTFDERSGIDYFRKNTAPGIDAEMTIQWKTGENSPDETVTKLEQTLKWMSCNILDSKNMSIASYSTKRIYAECESPNPWGGTIKLGRKLAVVLAKERLYVITVSYTISATVGRNVPLLDDQRIKLADYQKNIDHTKAVAERLFQETMQGFSVVNAK